MARRNPSTMFENLDVPRDMTSAHFNYIAAIINSVSQASDRKRIAIGISADMRRSNPAFDSDRFYAACGVE